MSIQGVLDFEKVSPRANNALACQDGGDFVLGQCVARDGDAPLHCLQPNEIYFTGDGSSIDDDVPHFVVAVTGDFEDYGRPSTSNLILSNHVTTPLAVKIQGHLSGERSPFD